MTAFPNFDPTALPGSPSEALRISLHEREHVSCFSSRTAESGGLGIDFHIEGNQVKALWTCGADKESFRGIVHGGILATALDGAMVELLFGYGIVSRTGKMELRFRDEVRSGLAVEISARLIEHRHPLYSLEATILQNGKKCVEAKAKFMAVEGGVAQ
jgi:acyl-coenzyme A thioesterase PaaI-like protein